MNNSWKKKARMIRNYGSSGLCFAVIIGVVNLSVTFIRDSMYLLNFHQVWWEECGFFHQTWWARRRISTRFGERGVDFSTKIGGETQVFHSC